MGMFIRDMTVKDMNEIIGKIKTVIIPVGVVEQHGFHLTLDTDILNVEMPLKLCIDKLDAVAAPMVNYCFSGGELNGTINVNPNIFGLYITEICTEYIRLGFKNIVVFLGHAGTENMVALENSLQILLKRDEIMKDITVSLVKVWELSPSWMECFNMEPQHDFHAGLAETSVMMYWAPEKVRSEIVTDEKEIIETMRVDPDFYAYSEKKVDHPYVVPRIKQKPEVKVGVMGFPERASAELGEKIAGEITDNLIKYINLLNKEN